MVGPDFLPSPLRGRSERAVPETKIFQKTDEHEKNPIDDPGAGRVYDPHGAGFQDHARPLALRPDLGRRHGGLGHQQTRPFVGRGGRGRRTQFLRRGARTPLRNRGRAQTGPQDAAQHPPERASARHEIPLPHLFTGGARVEIQRQGLLRRHRGIERLLAPAVRVQHPPHVGMRPLVRRSERHPRAGRLHGRALPPDRLRTDRLRGLQRRHVEQHRKSRTALPRLHRRLGRGLRRRSSTTAATTRHAASTPTTCRSTSPRSGATTTSSTWPAR